MPSLPAAFARDPLILQWPAGRQLWRCYHGRWGPADFFANDPGTARFSPFTPDGQATPLKVLYAADTQDGALSETVLRDVPVSGRDREIDRASAQQRMLASLDPVQSLQLVDCTSIGLRRLQVSRAHLIESPSQAYLDTVRWAKSLHAHPLAFDGMAWVSRQHDTSIAVVLFADRVQPADIILTNAAHHAVAVGVRTGT